MCDNLKKKQKKKLFEINTAREIIFYSCFKCKCCVIRVSSDGPKVG